MKFKELEIPGVFQITTSAISDDRGFFMRAYDARKFKKIGVHCEWLQENESYSKHKGIIRGLHFQTFPYSEAKLIRCISGEVLNVFVDLRKNSPTFGKWNSVKLSKENNRQLFLPRGMANGFGILKDDSQIIYKSDNYYNSDYEGHISWNDSDLEILWGIKNPILSDKDRIDSSFRDFVSEYGSLE